MIYANLQAYATKEYNVTSLCNSCGSALFRDGHISNRTLWISWFCKLLAYTDSTLTFAQRKVTL